MSTNGGGGGGGPASSRWNPAKEQITMLENFYKQGIRTPTAEQIEEITKKLQVYGHIEGKNVFYWFQNHKARQRQKQKQKQVMASYNYTNNCYKPGFFPPPNVVCSPYYLALPPLPPPQGELGFYQQYPMVLPPPAGGVINNMKRTPMVLHNGSSTSPSSSFSNQAETLPLFPLEPTGILQSKSPSTTTTSSSDTTTAIDHEEGSSNHVHHQQPNFFNFFSGNCGSCESD